MGEGAVLRNRSLEAREFRRNLVVGWLRELWSNERDRILALSQDCV
jgi:hypothetical protein